jgi:hypothetical protein
MVQTELRRAEDETRSSRSVENWITVEMDKVEITREDIKLAGAVEI